MSLVRDTKKDLHLGKTLADLEKLSIIPDVRTKTIKILLNTARKLFLDAESHNRDGDEELAYIFYMRYFNLLSCIHKKSDYAQHKQAVREVLGDTANNRRIMDKLELLSNSLSKRYDLLNKYARRENGTIQTTVIKSEIERQQQQQQYSKRSDGGRNTFVENDFSLDSMHSISCQALFERMQQQTVLIMDCRTSNDYKMSHLSYGWSVNVPEELIVAGMSAGKLQDTLDSASKALWAARSVKDYVVLMDWNTKDVPPAQNSTIATLLDILKNWDPDVTYRSPIKILEGGYEYFIMMYPTLCTNPSVQAPQQNNNDFETIDDIEYPSIHDITMKDEISDCDFSRTPERSLLTLTIENNKRNKPNVDRSSKLAALRTYDEKQKPIGEIMKEQAELLEKAQANDEELEQASKKWKNIYELKRLSEDGVSLSNSEQELLYNIMQLESTAEDYKIENDRLRDELDRYKNVDIRQSQILTPTEVEATKNIETKINERQLLDEQRSLERMMRERQLEKARETKPSYKTTTLPIVQTTSLPITMPFRIDDGNSIINHIGFNDSEDDDGDKENEVLTSKPLVDRSKKPISPTSPMPTTSLANNIYTIGRKSTRSRDFSPVSGNLLGRGLTGLKNLGNTCYMNSILQCLSNTPQLTEYCISDKYKNYISRNNKTRGQIVEEVAALIKILWNGNYKCVASNDLRYVIGQYQHIFKGIEQQDSHEFLTILMDWLHSDLQTLHVPSRPRDSITASEKAWLEFTKAKESLILHLFYGQIKSTVKCVACHKESATYECFSNLSLELPSNANICYLNQCMDMYFSGELIHGWNCPNCKQKRDAIKKLDISKLPPVLVIHLKRFYADPNAAGNYFVKKQNYLRFPLENLDMTPYIAKAESRSVTPKTYQLYGVSNHYGSMEGGHYTAFCKSSNYGRWFKFDDQIVTGLETSNVVSRAAYILFYTWLPPIQINDN